MYNLVVNGTVIPLSRKKNAGYDGHYRAAGPFGKVSIHHYQAAEFTLTFIECAVTADSTIEFLHDMVQPKIYAVLSGRSSTLVVEGAGLPMKEKQYGLLYSSHGNRAISLPAGQRCVYCIIHFPVAFLKEAIPEHGALIPFYIHTLRGRKYVSTPLFMDRAMEKELDAMWPIRTTGETSSPQALPPAIKTFLHHAFVHVNHAIQEGSADNRASARKIRQAAAIISNDPAGTYTIDSLSLQVGLSPSSLKRGFQRIFQTTIQDYVIEKRLEAAVRLLINTNLTEEVIAARFGYSGNDALIHSFKREFGCTPRFVRIA
jgi:AraC-like DNA-binding protein